jgi:hypothetical protein
MRSFPKKTVAIAGAALIVAVGAGTAYAYWSSGGTGTGSATTGTSTALAVNQTSTLTPMFPGDTAQTLSGDFDNTSNGPVHVASVTVSVASVTVGGTPAAGCTAADYTITGATMSAVQDVAVGTGVGDWSGATIQFNNTGTNQDACQGATVNLAYAVA